MEQQVNASSSEKYAETNLRWVAKWVIPEKIHTPPPPPPTDGTLEILTGGGIEGSGNPGRRGGLDLKILLQGSFSP